MKNLYYSTIIKPRGLFLREGERFREKNNKVMRILARDFALLDLYIQFANNIIYFREIEC